LFLCASISNSLFEFTGAKWLQNYGLISYNNYIINGDVTQDSIILISFNGQPFDINAVTGTKSYSAPSTKHISFKFSKDQIRFDNLSPNDRLNFRMYDCLGKLLFSRQQTSGNDILSIARFPHEPFIIMFQKNQENWERSLIIKQ
jgi:hypothetical protein